MTAGDPGEAVGRVFLDESRRYLSGTYLPRIEACLDGLSEADVWWRPNEASNAIGNLLLHLRGNVAQWIVGGVGGRPFERDRAHEFAARGPVPKAALYAPLAATVREADDVLSELTPEALLEPRVVQGLDRRVLEAVYHTVEHFGMHTGQIQAITKARTGRPLGQDR